MSPSSFQSSMNGNPTSDEEDYSNVFRILITNDNHVGFKEDDKVRNRDALATFEEILRIARDNKVDFVLHSGDLFDDARPNRFWMNAIMQLFRKYCFGDNAVSFQQIPTEFSNPANFEDANFNVDLPVFMIHGNHDDCGGEFGDSGSLSCGDLLATANFVTYFGRHDNVEEEIEIAPILLQKGTSKVALYGLGNIRDERLHRMFISKKVRFVDPPSGFFNLMSIHQNRLGGAAPAKSCVYPAFLPNFFDLVVWAHEHECIPSPIESVEAGFHILQSGSSVATSLTKSERSPKHVFILEVRNDHQFRTIPIPLQTVRTLIVEETVGPLNETCLAKKIEEILLRATSIPQQNIACDNFLYPPRFFNLPLVRLKVLNSPEIINNQKFGKQFVNRIANPDDILLCVKGRCVGRRGNSGVVQLELEDAPDDTQQTGDVQDLIFNYMGGLSGEALLDVLVEPDFNVAVQDFVHKSDPQAIDRYVKTQIDAISKIALDTGVCEVSQIHEVSKKRAQNDRNERLNGAAQMDTNVHTNVHTNLDRHVHSQEESSESETGENFLTSMFDEPSAKRPRGINSQAPKRAPHTQVHTNGPSQIIHTHAPPTQIKHIHLPTHTHAPPLVNDTLLIEEIESDSNENSIPPNVFQSGQKPSTQTSQSVRWAPRRI